jgi:hypothetical protein
VRKVFARQSQIPAGMFSLVYISSASSLFSPSQLEDLLGECRRNNAATAITGLLLYKEGNLLQVLEGEEEQVRSLYAKILRDPRHHGSIVLLQQTLADREFGDWSMGFRDLASAEVQAMPGYSEFLNFAWEDRHTVTSTTRVGKLLAFFRNSR